MNRGLAHFHIDITANGANPNGVNMMYIMYVDESGDPGPYALNPITGQAASKHYALSGLIIPESEWLNYLDLLIKFRKWAHTQYKVPQRVELKGSQLIHPRNARSFSTLTKKKRIQIYREALLTIARMRSASVISVYLDKINPKTRQPLQPNADYQLICWDRLVQRYHRFLQQKDAYGLIVPDETNERKLRQYVRKVRRFNVLPSQFSGSVSTPLGRLIEDPVVRDSKLSYFVQCADLIVHSLYRKEQPVPSLKSFNVDKLYGSLSHILVKNATHQDPLGIVRP